MHGSFPRWIEGEWNNISLGLSMSIIRNKPADILISIEQEDYPEKIRVVETGYIGHSGIFMSLDSENWLDRPILFEFSFDSHIRKIACDMRMMVSARKMSACDR